MTSNQVVREEESGRRSRSHRNHDRAAASGEGDAQRSGAPRAPLLSLVAATAVLGVAVIWALSGTDRFGFGAGPTGSGNSLEASDTPFTSSAIPQASPQPNPAQQSPESSASAPIIGGVLPGPNESVPPREQGIPGMSIHDIAGIAAQFGMSCESYAQDPSQGGSYGLDCRRDDDGVSTSIVVGYWGLDYVDQLHAVTVASGEGSIDSGSAVELFSGLAAELVGAEAEDWVTARIDSPECALPGCNVELGASRLTILVGENGARQLDIAPAREIGLSDCDPVPPTALPDGSEPSAPRLSEAFPTEPVLEWGVGSGRLIQFPGHRSSFDPSDPAMAPAEGRYAQVRGQRALLLLGQDPAVGPQLGLPSIGWLAPDGCPYIVYLPAGTTLDQLASLADSY